MNERETYHAAADRQKRHYTYAGRCHRQRRKRLALGRRRWGGRRIHRAAGPELLAECKALGGCATGHAKLTKGYALPCRYVIHTVGPRWCGGAHGERELLTACYRSSLALALEHGCASVAFPLIASGVYGFPKDLALRTAIDAIGDFLLAHDMTVYLVIFDRKAYQIGSKLFADITAYIDDRYAAARADERGARQRRVEAYPVCGASVCMQADAAPAPRAVGVQHPGALKDALEQLDESFSEMLLRKIDERGMDGRAVLQKGEHRPQTLFEDPLG